MAKLQALSSLQAMCRIHGSPVHYCRFTARLWNSIKDWLGMEAIDTRHWEGLGISEWWSMMSGAHMPNRKAMATLTLLISWEVWSDRNVRVFLNKQAPSHLVFDKIKREARLWVLAGSKHLGERMPGE
jgi:hypothetical protein